MKSKNEKIGLVVLTAILAISSFVASGTSVSAQPVEVWNVTWGGTGYDTGDAIAATGDSVYLAGGADDDVFLNKYDTDGTLIWNLTWGGTGASGADAIATTEASVYLAGSTNDDLYGFLNKYDSDGNLLWNITWDGDVSGVATAGESVYLAGDNYFPDADDADAFVFLNQFLNKYDKDGNLLWNITWGEIDNIVEGARATAATSDSVYLAGTINDTDGFLNKYNSTDGTLIWNITTENALGFATATTGDSVYLAGITWTAAGADDDAFLNKYDTDGNLLWNITWGEIGDNTGDATAATGDSVYLAGGAGGATGGPDPLIDVFGLSNFTAFLNKYNSTAGDLIWNITWGWGKPFNDTFATATATTGDNVYLAGHIGSPADTDAFIVKFSEQTSTPTVTPTPSENETGECKTLWYFDDQSVQCQQKQFCGMYMYESLRTFETEEECKAAFEKYLKEKGKETPTPASPGFEAGFAIAGLLAVAYLVLRRRK